MTKINRKEIPQFTIMLKLTPTSKSMKVKNFFRALLRQELLYPTNTMHDNFVIYMTVLFWIYKYFAIYLTLTYHAVRLTTFDAKIMPNGDLQIELKDDKTSWVMNDRPRYRPRDPEWLYIRVDDDEISACKYYLKRNPFLEYEWEFRDDLDDFERFDQYDEEYYNYHIKKNDNPNFQISDLHNIDPYYFFRENDFYYFDHIEDVDIDFFMPEVPINLDRFEDIYAIYSKNDSEDDSEDD